MYKLKLLKDDAGLKKGAIVTLPDSKEFLVRRLEQDKTAKVVDHSPDPKNPKELKKALVEVTKERDELRKKLEKLESKKPEKVETPKAPDKTPAKSSTGPKETK
jgi:hypothetical protein